jgi:hypothetical protein
MTTKSLLMTGALALASFSVGYAKSYDVVFSGPVKAGNVDLKAGEYSLNVKGNTATFKEVNTDKSYSTPVKVENADKKHTVTAVDTTKQNGTNQIRKIELGGSATDLEFGD